MRVKPFLYWRKAASLAGLVAIGFAAQHHDGLAIACAVMAIGWALCDVVAWRDYRRLVKVVECKSSIRHSAPDGTLIKHTHWCGCEIA